MSSSDEGSSCGIDPELKALEEILETLEINRARLSRASETLAIYQSNMMLLYQNYQINLNNHLQCGYS